MLAHELGHFQHRHVLKRMVMMFGLSLLAFALLGWLSRQADFYLGLGVSPNLNAPNDALALLLMLALPPFAFFIVPLMSGFSRRDEYEATTPKHAPRHRVRGDLDDRGRRYRVSRTTRRERVDRASTQPLQRRVAHGQPAAGRNTYPVLRGPLLESESS